MMMMSMKRMMMMMIMMIIVIILIDNDDTYVDAPVAKPPNPNTTAKTARIVFTNNNSFRAVSNL